MPALLVTISIDSIPHSLASFDIKGETNPCRLHHWVSTTGTKMLLCVESYIERPSLLTQIHHLLQSENNSVLPDGPCPSGLLDWRNLPELLLAVIGVIIIGLGARAFPHYFLPSVNLLSQSTSEDHVCRWQKCYQVHTKPDNYSESIPNFETYCDNLRSQIFSTSTRTRFGTRLNRNDNEFNVQNNGCARALKSFNNTHEKARFWLADSSAVQV